MPANPLRGATNVPFSNHDYGAVKNSMVGLTKRETAAIAAMQGFIISTDNMMSLEQIALQSVQMADVLFEELDK